MQSRLFTNSRRLATVLLALALVFLYLFTPAQATTPGTATLTGTMTDQYGQPLHMMTVSVSDGWSQWNVMTDEHGVYTITDILPGSYSVLAGPDFYFDHISVYVTLAADEVRTEDFVFGDGPSAEYGAVTGDVIGWDGWPIQGATVQLSANGRVWKKQSDMSGQFAIGGLPAGSYALYVLDPMSESSVQYQNLLVKADGTVTVRAHFTQSATETTGAVAGTVTDSFGTPAAMLSVSVSNANLYYLVKTDMEGHFGVGDLEPGTYSVNVVAADGVTSQSSPVTVTAGETVPLTFAF